MFLYNVPGRTVVNILPETVARLAELDNIIGIKEACGSLEQISDVIRFCPNDFLVFSGDDFTSMPTVFVGGHGVISVVSNLAPRAMAQMMEAALKGDIKGANDLHYRLFSLMKLMFRNPSPAPAKKALEMMGKIKDGSPRLPITGADGETTALLKEALTSLGML
jgi:4-hydroxy-tetrahydrodipicolinate synthase